MATLREAWRRWKGDAISDSVFDDPAMVDAEAQLRSALENLLEGMSEGPTIHNVHSYGWTEGGATFTVMCELPDGTLGLWSFEPGRPVHYSVHDVGMEPSELPTADAVALPLAGAKRLLSAAVRWLWPT